LTNIIVAFAKIEEAKSVKNILVKNGFGVTAVCSSGAQALGFADEFQYGVIISGFRIADMICVELKNSIPVGFELLVMAPQRLLVEVSGTGIMGLAMPLKVHELTSTVGMMSQEVIRRKKKQKEKPRVRNAEDEAIIESAKLLLMERNKMTEEEAHRYLLKRSMDNSINLVETAQMLLALN